MVDWSTALTAGTFGLTLLERKERREMQQQMETGNAPEPTSPDLQFDKQISENTQGAEQALDRLVKIEEKQGPTPGDKDAFASATINLGTGETAEVTVEPQDGWNLRVKRVHFDRRDNHSYEINVGGDVTSVSHRAKYASPRLVSQSDRVLASVTNESGSSTIVDFEMEAWAERPRK